MIWELQSAFVTFLKGKKKEREWKLSWLKGFYSMYIDVYLIDNLIYFIGSPTCISHTLQVGSCLAQGESSHKHREEHLWEMESSIAINDYRVTSAHMCSRKTSSPALGYSSHLTNRVQDNETHYIKSQTRCCFILSESLTANLAENRYITCITFPEDTEHFSKLHHCTYN